MLPYPRENGGADSGKGARLAGSAQSLDGVLESVPRWNYRPCENSTLPLASDVVDPRWAETVILRGRFLLSNAGERVLYVTGLTIVARQDSNMMKNIFLRVEDC